MLLEEVKRVSKSVIDVKVIVDMVKEVLEEVEKV